MEWGAGIRDQLLLEGNQSVALRWRSVSWFYGMGVVVVGFLLSVVRCFFLPLVHIHMTGLWITTESIVESILTLIFNPPFLPRPGTFFLVVALV